MSHAPGTFVYINEHLMWLAAGELASRVEDAGCRLLSPPRCDLLPADQDVRKAGRSAARSQLAALYLGVA